MIRNILSPVLKGNKLVQKGILTGVFDILKMNIDSGLNNMRIYSIANNKFSSSYGFSRN
jgi:hypothetical protein